MSAKPATKTTHCHKASQPNEKLLKLLLKGSRLTVYVQAARCGTS